MSRERQLLERAYYVLGELSYAILKDSGEYNLAGDIYEFLSAPKPEQDEEPVAYIRKDQLEKASRSAMLCEVSPEPRQDRVGLFLHPAPRPEFVRLSEEEIMDLCRGKCVEFRWPSTAIETARAIEDALEEANRYKPFVRLSEEEVSEILSSAHTPYEAICAVENRLVEKNRG